MEFLKAMEPVVEDCESTLRRFVGNEGLWERFVRKFPGDQAYQNICEATAEQDVERIIREAHTLKGIAANLGFDALSQAASKMVEHGRHDQPECFPKDLDEIRTEYDRVIEAIQQLD